MTKQRRALQLAYFADPMCSWCWGFSPVIEAIERDFAGRLAIAVVMGGLRPFTTSPMRDTDKAEIRHHWEQVRMRTGQPFDMDFLDRAGEGFVYDTEPAARALVTVRTMGVLDVLAMLHRLQEAFYAQGRDVTGSQTLADIAAEAGIDRAAFLAAFDSDQMRQSTRTDFAISQQVGIRGFPACLIGSDAGGYRLLNYGYQDYAALKPSIETALAG